MGSAACRVETKLRKPTATTGKRSRWRSNMAVVLGDGRGVEKDSTFGALSEQQAACRTYCVLQRLGIRSASSSCSNRFGKEYGRMSRDPSRRPAALLVAGPSWTTTH